MNDSASSRSDGPPDPAASADWSTLARLASREPAASETERAQEAAARAWLAAHPGEADRLAALDQVVRATLSGASVTQVEMVDVPAVDVEAALARVRAAAREGRIAPADHTAPPLTVVRGGAPRTSAPPRVTARHVMMPRPVPVWRRGAGLVAAAALLAAGVSWWRTGGLAGRALVGPAVASGGTASPQRYATAVGQRQVLHLADGTQVVLGPASTLDVPAGYGGPARRVRLVGDAYFRAVHDAARPFEVAAGDALVRDIGTAFVVRASGSTPGTGRTVDVSVTDGSVRLEAVTDSAPRPAGTAPGGVLLRAGDRGRVAVGGATLTPAVAVVARGSDTAVDTAWTTGRLVFRDTPMREVAGALRRWYGVDLRFADAAVADRHLTATFAGDSTDAVLRVVGLAIRARLDRHGDTVVVQEATRSP